MASSKTWGASSQTKTHATKTSNENEPTRRGTHRLETGLVEGRALDVLDGADGLGHVEALLEADGGELLLGEARLSLGVLTKIQLSADEEEGSVGAVVLDLRVPLGLDVLERGGRDDRIANQEDVGLRVGQRTEAIIVW